MWLEACTTTNIINQENLIAIWKMNLHPCPSLSVTEEFSEWTAVTAILIIKALLKHVIVKKILIVFHHEKPKL